MAVFDYINDLGFTFYRVELRFFVEGSPETSYELDEIAPQVILNAVIDDPITCSLIKGYKYREVIVRADDENLYHIPLPFQPRTAQYNDVIAQLTSSNLVESFKMVGEKIPYWKLPLYVRG